mmetsp:Transcript_18996/g.58527  ORF Transcript_18996/g.58527 Transcript_18996/m.58527 type:complete len:415 (+) Transcript_18996:143-1387(+)
MSSTVSSGGGGAGHPSTTTTTTEGEKSRRPKEDAWRQQKVPAWRPLITRDVVTATFFVVGLIAMAMGWILKSVESQQVYQRKIQYDGSDADVGDCKIHRANAGRVCNVSLRINHKMEAPAYVYYEIENFYQNHQRYITSLSAEQLMGANLKKGELSECQPLKRNGSKILSPCGLQANSMFNDVITLQNPDLTMRENKIAWRSDRKQKFSQPNHFDWSTTAYNESFCGFDEPCPDFVCRSAGVHTGCRGYVCRGGDFDDGKCEAGQHAVFYYRGFDDYQFLYQTFPRIISPIVGQESERFIVWMRLGGLSHFRKLYGRITDTLHEGDHLTFTIVNNFNVDSFHGKKSIVVSTSSSLGANLSVLWAAYLGFGVATFVFAALLFAKASLAPRQLGDTSFLAAADSAFTAGASSATSS